MKARRPSHGGQFLAHQEFLNSKETQMSVLCSCSHRRGLLGGFFQLPTLACAFASSTDLLDQLERRMVVRTNLRDGLCAAMELAARST